MASASHPARRSGSLTASTALTTGSRAALPALGLVFTSPATSCRGMAAASGPKAPAPAAAVCLRCCCQPAQHHNRAGRTIVLHQDRGPAADGGSVQVELDLRLLARTAVQGPDRGAYLLRHLARAEWPAP